MKNTEVCSVILKPQTTLKHIITERLKYERGRHRIEIEERFETDQKQ